MSAPEPAIISAACRELAGRDEVLARAYAEIGVPVWRATDANYETLARAVAYQLISTIAAAAIWARVLTFLGNDVSAQKVLAVDEAGLRDCGMSRPKVAHMRSIAAAVTSGALCFERVQTCDPDTARKELLSVKGIGPWTADLFLMNAVGHVDAFPIGDVGVMQAYKQLSKAETRHSAKDFTALAEHWRPFRGVAAHLLWGWLNAQRGAQTETP